MSKQLEKLGFVILLCQTIEKKENFENKPV